MSKKRRAACTVATLLVLAALWGGGDLYWDHPAWAQSEDEEDTVLLAQQQEGPADGGALTKADGSPTMMKRIGVFVGGGDNPGLGDTFAEIVLAAATTAMESEAVGPELLRGKLKLDARQLESCLTSDECLQSVAEDHDLFGIVLGWLQPGKKGEDCSLKLTLFIPGEGKGRFLPLAAPTCDDLIKKVVRAKVETLFAARKKALAKAAPVPPPAEETKAVPQAEAPVPPPAETKATFEDTFGQCKHKAGLAVKKQIPLAAALEPCEQALGLLASAKDDGARAKALFFVAKQVYYVLGTTENPASRVGHMNLAVLTAKRAHELSVAANDIEFTGEIDRFTDAIVKGYSSYDLRPGLGWAELRPEFRVIDMQIIRAPIAVDKKQALGLLQTQFKRGVELPVTVWIPFGKPAVRDALGQITLDAQIVISLNGVAFEVVAPSDRKDAGMIMVPALANVEDFLKPPRLMAVTASLLGSPGAVGGYAGFGLGLVPGLTLRFEGGGASVSSTADALKPLSGEVGLSALLEWCPAGTAWSADLGLCFGGGGGGAWLLSDEAGGLAGTVKLSAALKLPVGFTVELEGRGTFGGMGYVYPALGVRWQYLFGGTPASQEKEKAPAVVEKTAGDGEKKAGGEVKGAAKEVAL